MKRLSLFFTALVVSIPLFYAQETTTDCDTILLKEGVKYAYPRLSSDQKSILYQSNASGHWQLQLFHRETQTSVLIGEDSLNNYFPDWSPDNRYIAFTSDRNGYENIYLLDSETKQLKAITNNKARNIHPYFSPDGRYILYNSTAGNNSLDVYLYDRNTGTSKRITKTVENETCARFSPDMTKLVYLKNSEKSDDIIIYTIKTAKEQNISNTPQVRDGWPVFSPDGKAVYYSSLETGSFCVVRYDLSTKTAQQMTTAKDEVEHARCFPAKDNTYFIYNIGYGETIAIAGCTI